MPRILLAIAVIYVAVLLYTVFDIALRDKSGIRVLAKPLWVLVAIVLPVIGILLWFFFGRVNPGAQRPRPGLAPDDDPEYLRKISDDLEQQRRRERHRREEED